MSKKVFVYGTLKSGKSNHDLLKGQKFLGRSAVLGQYKFVDLGPFPAVVMDPSCSPNSPTMIVGEVYEIEDAALVALDILEGHPNFYSRKEIDTAFGKAWMYSFAPDARVDKSWKTVDRCWRPTQEETSWMKGFGKPADEPKAQAAVS